ncbi:MAG: hypothetical protein GXY83_41780, partial [Rhodopirellula sp.]|nr:hypothetical protein [Rhodopirellula sp.]
MQVVDSAAYVVNETGGLVILNVSNPASVSPLGVYDTPGTAYDVQVIGNLTYVADGSAGLAILDTSDPAAITPLGGYDTTGEARGLSV